MQQVNFMLDVQPRGLHGMFYYGYDQGFYSSKGIGLNFLFGSGSSSVIAAVATGKADFGFADTGTLVVSAATANASNVRVVGMIYAENYNGIIYNKAVIKKISDLNGKTAAASQGGAPAKLFTVFAKLNNISVNTIQITYSNPSSYQQLVALGKTDFILTTLNQLANLAPIADSNHIQLGYYRFYDYGMPIYGSALITSTDMIKNRPDTVRAFVNATMRSIVSSAHNPQAAVASVIKYAPQLNASTSIGDYEISMRTSTPNINSSGYLANPLTLGWVDNQKMQTTVKIIADGYGITTPLNASNFYTNQFVQKP